MKGVYYTMELTKEYLYENYIVKNKSQAQIARELNVTEAKIDYWTKKFGLQYKKSDRDKAFNLKHIDKSDPIFCYFAGLLATDGYFDYKNSRVSLRVNNEGSKEVFEAIREYIEYIRPVRCYDNGRLRLLYDITIPNKCIFNELLKMGISGPKDTRTFSLDWFNQASRECQLMFLRGVHDGDGSIHNKVFRISMKSELFIQNLRCVINKLCSSAYEIKTQSNQTHREYPLLQLRRGDTITFLDFIYTGHDRFRFKDKYNKYLDIVKSR